MKREGKLYYYSERMEIVIHFTWKIFLVFSQSRKSNKLIIFEELFEAS
jgi:hypothetical protein